MPGIEKSTEQINRNIAMLRDDFYKALSLIRLTLEDSTKITIRICDQIEQSGTSLCSAMNNHQSVLDKAASDLSGSVLTIREILNKAEESADKHAAGLKWATWVLVFATTVLAATGIIQLILSYSK